MGQETTENPSKADVVQMTITVVAAYVGHNTVEGDHIPEVIKSVYTSLSQLDGYAEPPGKTKQKPAVSIKRSINPDYLICLEDGVKMKMLKRRLRTSYGLSPEEYRVKWGLPVDYPMVASNYAKLRSDYAKKIGLGKRHA